MSIHASGIAKIAVVAALWATCAAWTVQASDLAIAQDGHMSRTEWLEGIFNGRAETAARLPRTLSWLEGAASVVVSTSCLTCAGGSRGGVYCNASIECPGSYCNTPPFCSR